MKDVTAVLLIMAIVIVAICFMPKQDSKCSKNLSKENDSLKIVVENYKKAEPKYANCYFLIIGRNKDESFKTNYVFNNGAGGETLLTFDLTIGMNTTDAINIGDKLYIIKK